MKSTYYIFALISCIAYCVIDGGVFIIVHGTWSTVSTWSNPDGDFFDVLEQNAQLLGHAVIPFTWSGNLEDSYRIIAGKNLAKIIHSYPSSTEFYIVAHSHGGNVAIRASQELAKYAHNNHRIKILYTLGTPIDREHYMPNMEVIEYCYNFFSLNDIVQPVLGLFNRTHPQHERIANIRVFINGKEPDHHTLHHPSLARWLPALHDMLVRLECSPAFAWHIPGIIDFNETQKPLYTFDVKRQSLLEQDQALHKQLYTLFRCQKLQASTRNILDNDDD